MSIAILVLAVLQLLLFVAVGYSDDMGFAVLAIMTMFAILVLAIIQVAP